MNKLTILTLKQKWILLITLSFLTTTAFAANECKVKYQHKSSRGQVYTKYLNLNSGQTKNVRARHLKYVKNLKQREVKIWVGSYSKVLNQNAVDPFPGFHLADVEFKKVKCQGSNGPTPIDVVVQQMKNAGSNATQIAQHLKNILGQNIFQIGNWLKSVGFSIGEVAVSLKRTFNAKAPEVARVLYRAYHFSDRKILAALNLAGYTINQAAPALKNILNATAEEAGPILKSVFGATETRVASALKIAGYSAVGIATVLDDAFSWSTTRIRNRLASLGFTATEAARAIESIAEDLADMTVIIKSVNYANYPNANAAISMAYGSKYGKLEIRGHNLGQIKGVRGIPFRSVRIYPVQARKIKGQEVMIAKMTFASASGTETRRVRASGTAVFTRADGRAIANSGFRWKILDRAKSDPSRRPVPLSACANGWDYSTNKCKK